MASATVFCMPSVAAEKGIYVHASGGVNSIESTIVDDDEYNVDFDDGAVFEVGVGYSFGNNFRMEGSYSQSYSENYGSYDWEYWDDGFTIKSLMASVYYDLDTGSKLAPFLGFGLGTASLDNGFDTTDTFTYSFQAGLSYELSDKLDLVGKATYQTLQEYDLEGYDMNSHSLLQGTLGLRYTF